MRGLASLRFRDDSHEDQGQGQALAGRMSLLWRSWSAETRFDRDSVSVTGVCVRGTACLRQASSEFGA